MHRRVRRGFNAVLGASLALTAAAGGCARGLHSSPGGEAEDASFAGDAALNLMTGQPLDLDGSVPQGTCAPNLVSIKVSPATTSTSVVYANPLATTKQQFSASGTYKDGTTADVTQCVGWTVSPAIASITQMGAFSSGAAGQYTVTATSDQVSGSAVITIKLTGAANPSGITTSLLDATPGGAAPTVAYPLDGALFPYHFGDLAFQMVPASGQTIARIAFVGDAIDLDVYAPCTPIANPAVAGGCSVAIPADLEASLAGASEATNLTETVRMASATGANLGESGAIDARWASLSLPGTVYYWSAPPSGGGGASGASEIRRMDLTKPGTPPEVFYQWLDAENYSDMFSGGWACIGCHAITQDGKYMGITIGGSAIPGPGSMGQAGGGNGSFFALVDIASRTPLAAAIVSSGGQFLPAGFATYTTFAPDDKTMVQELQGQLFLRDATAQLTSGPALFPTVTESVTDPYWSAKGDILAFASWNATGQSYAYDPVDLNGNEIKGAQIWTAPATGTTFGTPTLLVPRVSGATEYYPAISDDSALVVFNESSCSGPPTSSSDGYGASPCDGYDDPSARLRLISSKGGSPVELDQASGRTSGWPTSDTWANSWSRFSPQHGIFQGKTLYWVTFSSRRPYGATLAGSTDGSTSPQLWFAGVVVDPTAALTGDPSYAPVWLPLQNSATPEITFDGGTRPSIAAAGGQVGSLTGNHSAQWVYSYVPYVPPNMPPPPPPLQ
jgi:hypothetical protein